MTETMLAELCRRMGGRSVPSPDSFGGYALPLSDGFTPVITPGRDGVGFAGEILELPTAEQDREALCRELLTLSLGRTGQECEGYLPHITAEGNKLILRQMCGAFLAVDDLEAALERFVNLMEKWRSLALREKGRQSFRSGGSLQGIIIP
ncbi:MAG: hypothetical protein LBV80_05950 [Deltaproteobacteria bacterium]|jgi:hypothetical protein|nr:hypothetical protein [Deltaproteobacteria bacterium]